MTQLPLIILQLTKIPKDDDYLAQIIISPRGTSDQERFALADTHEVFRSDDNTAQTLVQLKTAIDNGGIGSGEMERLGEFLYNRIFTGLVERKLRDVMIQEKERPYRLCILIHKSAPFLETIPWEYMKQPDGFVALSGLASVTRVLEDRNAQPFDPLEGATMLLVYANPRGYGDSERHAKIEEASTVFINEFIQRLETQYNLKVTKLIREEATRDNFLKLLEQHFDIVHFIGHGELKQGDGNIIMHDKKAIPGKEIHNNLSNNPPRLFYFNSCSTAKANDRDSFSSVAQALIRPESKAVPVVIAMQYQIDVTDSFAIAEEFYERLLNPQSRTFGNLERSMDYARLQPRLKNPSWGIPVLFLQTRERAMLFGEPAAERPPAQLKFHLASNIPAATNLVNRAEEIAAVQNLLSSDRRLLMVTGLPGVGRGALVRAGLAPYIQDKREEIPIWLNLEGLKPEDATLDTLYLSLDRILEARLERLWFRDEQHWPLDEKLAELEKKIPNTAILVLENIDPLLDEESRFRDKRMEQFFRHFGKTTQRIFIITTSSAEPKSRDNAEEWKGLWQTLKLQPLKVEDAVALLKNEGLTHSDQALRSLAETVDGHPQTLKILASGIRQRSISLDRITGATKAAGLTAFPEAIRASLTEPETRALKLWSVFRNPVIREALTQTADGDSVVDSLVIKGLLKKNDEYYSVPNPVRSAIHDELQREPALRDDAHRLAAAFFIYEAERANVETESTNNYLEARYHLRERADPESKRRAQRFAERVFQTLMDHGRHSELRVLIEQSDPLFSDDFMVEFFRAELDGVFGQFESALDTLELLSYRVKDGSIERGSIANEIGVVLKMRSDPRDADAMLAEFETAYDIFANIIRTTDDHELMERALHSQAVCTYNRGLVYQYFRRGHTPDEFNQAYAMARKLYESALQIYQTLKEPDELGAAMAYSQLGELLADERFAEKDLRLAEQFLREAVQIAERTGKPRIEANAAYQLARFLRRRGDSEAARKLFRQAADVSEQIGLQAERAIAEVQIAEIDFESRHYDRVMLDLTLSRNEETLSYYDDFHSIRVQSDAYFLHGLLHLAQNNQDQASEYFENSRSVTMRVEALSQSRADAKRIARGTFFLAKIAFEQEGAEAARAIITEVQEHFEKIGYKLGENEPVGDFIGRINEWRR